MEYAVILTFIIGYAAIVFEHPLKIDKTVPALLMAALCWAMIALGHPQLFDANHQPSSDVSGLLGHHVGKIAEILIFLIGAMTIVELVDMHKGFSVITNAIKTRKKTTLLWMITWFTFFLSAVLDNLTCTIVMVSLIKKILKNHDERLYFASIIVIAANAGGAWSPIGDVTTTMLWNNNQASSMGLVLTLFIPSVVCTLIPAFLFSRAPIMQGEIDLPQIDEEAERRKQALLGSRIMLWLGVAGLVFVPVFKTVTHLSPYVGMMFSLAIVWLASERLHPSEDIEDGHIINTRHALSKIDTSSILFFLGILMTIASLESLGSLKAFAEALGSVFPPTEMLPLTTGTDVIMVILGYGSAIVDNVPLVAAAQGMYSEVPIDAKMWHLLAFTAGTGGSMLIIGSAAGVAAMGMEHIDFMWYVRNVAWKAMLGFLAGVIVFLAMYPLFEGMFAVDPSTIINTTVPHGGGH